mgnify:CR=1 FL=1
MVAAPNDVCSKAVGAFIAFTEAMMLRTGILKTQVITSERARAQGGCWSVVMVVTCIPR